MAAYTKFTNVETTLLKVNGTDYNTRVAAIEADVSTNDDEIVNLLRDVSTAEGKITALEEKEGKALKYIKVGSVAFGDLTSGTAKALALANVPAGSMITQVICLVTDAFNSGSGDTIAVGISGTANKFLATTDITATTVGAYTKAVAYYDDTAATTVYATWTGTGTAADAGGFEVYVAYFKL